MRLKALIFLAVAVLVVGCASEDGTARHTTQTRSAAAGVPPNTGRTGHTRDLETDPELSADLQARILKGKLSLEQARQIDFERYMTRQQEVSRALDQIRREAREEYADNCPEPIRNHILKEEPCLGMTDKDVLVIWGEPLAKSHTVTHQGVRETWNYPKSSVWFESGIVTGWQVAR